MVGLLAEGERRIDELSNRLGLKSTEVFHHISKLEDLGLVNSRTEEGVQIYSLEASRLQEMNKQVMRSIQFGSSANLVEDIQYEDWQRKILNNYVDGERIFTLPSGYKKRLVVLNWVADHFDPRKKYTELEVNEKIEKHHEDYCTIRREMIDERMMERSEGIYWRLEWEMPNI